MRGRRAVATLDELRAAPPLALGGVTLIPLARVQVAVAMERGRVLADALKRVEAVVIVDGATPRAVDVAGTPLDLDDLRANVTGLDEILRGLPVPRTGRAGDDVDP